MLMNVTPSNHEGQQRGPGTVLLESSGRRHWWRLFRKAALAGQSFADSSEIEAVTALATTELNAHAKPWAWGRPLPLHRRLSREFT